MVEGDKIVVDWIRRKHALVSEAESRAIPGYKKDFEIGTLLRIVDEQEAIIRGIEESHND